MNPTVAELFKHGTQWLRADFHLHTLADKEFEYTGEESFFATNYIDRLATEEISLGVITNHNKFDPEEYNALAKSALKRGIFLLPGVELSVNDGSKGVHALVVFDGKTWIDGAKDWINDFINAAFHNSGVSDRANENARCGWNLKQLFEQLHDCRENHARDSFVILAHVEDSCGFCHDMEGGRIQEFGRQPLFWENVLGFQKVRTRDQVAKWKSWLERELPAFVEGSDPKTIEKVGVAHKAGNNECRTYLHVGDFTFDAVKLALRNHPNRVSKDAPTPNHPRVTGLTVEGSGADGVKLLWQLNSGLNALIGIRGSGKSTLLELLRYGLGVDLRGPWTTEPPDEPYKVGLIKSHLGSGGQVKITVQGNTGITYEVRRIQGEQPKVYLDDQLKPNLRPNGGVIRVLYFGQKDLSELGAEDRNTDLIEKFFSDELRDPRSSTTTKASKVQTLVQRLKTQAETVSRQAEHLATKAKLEESLKVFKEQKVEEKLNRQVAFNTDISVLGEMSAWLDDLVNSIKVFEDENRERLDEFLSTTSSENKIELMAAVSNLQSARIFLDSLPPHSEAITQSKSKINALRTKLSTKQGDLAEEFAGIRRQIQGTDLSADTYVELQGQLRATDSVLAEIKKEEGKRDWTLKELVVALTELGTCWHQEFRSLESKVETLNARKLPINLELQYRGNRKAFEAYLKDFLRGTGVTGITMERLIEEFADPIDLYNDISEKGERFKKTVTNPSSQQKLEQKIYTDLSDFLIYRVPDRLELSLRGKPLARHSLGQRTSALVLFLLEKGDYDLLLIDQPEDDLDNQTIYQDVICRLRELKSSHQYVFATHNANLPVLGEAEMVASCRYAETGMELTQGSTDCPPIQADIIAVMEGGNEAFSMRNQIYKQWKH